jgi:hypothetical protein
MQNVSKAADAAAEQLRGDAPGIAQHMHDAARELERFAQDLEERSIGDLMQNVTDFAKRQPTMFIAGSVLAGFMLTRFLKSSSSDENESASGQRNAQSRGEQWDGDHRGNDHVR